MQSLSVLLNLFFLSIKHSCTKKNLIIFQPACPLLLHRVHQRGHCYLVPCSFNRACYFLKKIRVGCFFLVHVRFVSLQVVLKTERLYSLVDIYSLSFLYFRIRGRGRIDSNSPKCCSIGVRNVFSKRSILLNFHALNSKIGIHSYALFSSIPKIHLFS